MKKNREPIIRISLNVNSQATLLELPGPEYSSSDEESLAQVKSLIQDLAEKTDQQYLVVDLSNVHYFGARFVGILVKAWDQLKKRQRHLIICGLTPFGARLFQVLYLDKLFSIYPTREVVSEKIGQSALGAGLDSKFGQNRLEISEVDWDKNLARLEFIGEDNIPVRSIIEPKVKLKEALRSAEP
jgi:anti-anti-sigma factor